MGTDKATTIEQTGDGAPAPAESRAGLPERLRRHLDYLIVQQVTERASGNHKTLAPKLRAEVWALADSLAGAQPTPMERTLAETAAIAWLALRIAELRSELTKNNSLRQAEWLERKVSHAHSRYLSSLRTLATVRKVARPALQLNVGVNQLNTVGALTGGAIPPDSTGEPIDV